MTKWLFAQQINKYMSITSQIKRIKRAIIINRMMQNYRMVDELKNQLKLLKKKTKCK